MTFNRTCHDWEVEEGGVFVFHELPLDATVIAGCVCIIMITVHVTVTTSCIYIYIMAEKGTSQCESAHA